MKEEPNSESQPTAEAKEKPGLFTRIFSKLDASMKEKADAQEPSSCCNGDNGKGGKCC
ncbi:MAG: hypothetical protein ACPGSB_05880 [Opitutales bacterium]